jgi:hypothetical protein
MMDQRPKPQGEKPRSEPEIILPGEAPNSSRMKTFVHSHGAQRIFIAKIGPFGFILVALTMVFLFVVMLMLLWGAFLIFIPVVGLLVAAAILSGVFRSYFQRPP